MRLTHFPPSQALRGHVSFLYVVETAAGAPAQLLGAVLGQVQIRPRGELFCAYQAGIAEPAPTALLAGPTHAPTRVDAPAGMLIVGAGLLPLGWARLVRVPAEALADRCIEARAIWGPGIECAAARIAHAQDDATRIAQLDDYLCRLLACAPAIDPRILAIDAWLAHVPHASVDTLTRSIELSSRQLRRLTTATHGAPPKLLASKYRTLRAATLFGAGFARNWQDVAEGFADQAHLIRNFQRFVGHAPRAFTRNETSLVRAVIRAKWQAGARSSLALWG